MADRPPDSQNRIAGVYAVTSDGGCRANILGSGSFGAVFKGVDVRTQGKVAIKVESRKAKHPQLVYEYQVLKELGDLATTLVSEGVLSRRPGIPVVYYFGPYGDTCLGLVMELLGPAVGGSGRDKGAGAGAGAGAAPAPGMPPATIAHIARCALHCLRFLHWSGFVHRDLKPENLLWRRTPGTDPVYLIDYGLAKRLIKPDGTHVDRREDKALVGTPQYAALHAHEGQELTRRDDIESLVYVLVFLAKGRLPWQDVKEAEPNDRYSAMGAAKEEVRSKDLIAGLDERLGHALQQTLYAAYNTAFEDAPDYGEILALWADL